MEADTAATTPVFVKWEEVVVSRNRGKREVRYYLKRKDGSSDLAVVGKEKSLGHMAYHYAIRDRSLLSISADSFMLKLISRRDVIDWLNSIVPGMDLHPHQLPQPACSSLDVKNACELNLETLKDVQLQKLGKYTKDFLWLGSASTCRKRRKHYQSFQRNGLKISVNDFVYVLAEEDKRLVAYLDDMYEDSRGNKMVVVRWFHKVDEVGIALPQNYNDREIFFSLCLQDLSIECLDGLASVLSPKHYENFMREHSHTQLEPFVCHRQFDNDDVKPFDITQVKGYDKQEILKYMYTSSTSNNYMRSRPANDGPRFEINCSDAAGLRPKKRLRRSKERGMFFEAANKPVAFDACVDVPDFERGSVNSKAGYQVCLPKEGCSDILLDRKDAIIQKHLQPFSVGAQVEVLSQDSGIRGCWFRASVIKKHKDKLKVRYQDIKDAADEVDNLEEWILAFRIAVPDELHLRISRRSTIRPAPLISKDNISWEANVGSVVDAWWHDCWWEGIVIRKESEDGIHVYFPAEKRESMFAQKDLRPSQEWLGTGWNLIKERPELVSSILSDLEKKLAIVKSCKERRRLASSCGEELIRFAHNDSSVICNKTNDAEVVRDLSKDLLALLKWKSSRKRSPCRNSVQKLFYGVGKNQSNLEVRGTQTWEKVFTPSSLKVDHDNCKYAGDSSFSSSVVSSLTSLVLSR